MKLSQPSASLEEQLGVPLRHVSNQRHRRPLVSATSPIATYGPKRRTARRSGTRSMHPFIIYHAPLPELDRHPRLSGVARGLDTLLAPILAEVPPKCMVPG